MCRVEVFSASRPRRVSLGLGVGVRVFWSLLRSNGPESHGSRVSPRRFLEVQLAGAAVGRVADIAGIIDKSAIEGQKQYHNDLEKGMRGYMKEHPTEFHVAGVKDPAEGDAEGEKEKLSAAEEYAAETRRKRQNQDYSALQGALDSVLGGAKAIFTGLFTAVESISDLLNLGEEGGKVVILGLIIAILVISNIYTYVAYKPKSSESRRLNRLGWDESGIVDVREGGYSEAAMAMFRNNEGRDSGLTTREEVNDLVRILDAVEQRASRLRGLLDSKTGNQGRGDHESLD